ncbi:hypothetical protein TTHERM_00825200 (macronuclear) [Tetrahymena thermophila SB210]|uniref:Uncharacterized protein n=1 Tax=Tetrahymena thermophila (strain SB210) TaxID=312017 RepID=I7MCE1_TETTS|nr:hypothetical protein TTHERM_00825200 [Tetrahymena thermophila SB210]EAR83725.1 hypothetical protein TTHERM_00825200 [Tetrahymena thermophila SB210]|eukprot:XP_001031388.1 hypothetical protein TTHERM_00825200 [Tetrahymena thermophila SB210]
MLYRLFRNNSKFNNYFNYKNIKYFSVARESIPLERVDKAQELVQKIISSHVAYKQSLIQLLETYHYFKNIESDSELRILRDLHNQHLAQLNEQVVIHRVPPPLIPFTSVSFIIFGGISSILDQKNCDQLAAQLCRIVENHTDYCLFQLNQQNLDQQDLRKMIIQMRDSSYDLSEKILSQMTEGNSCVQNISDYVFQPILRQHFGGVE